MKRLLYIILFLILQASAHAQQLPLYSQYLYNKFLINPAHAGSDGFKSINLTAREQWVGYSGAPRTISLSFQTRFLKEGYKIKQNLLNKSVYRPKTDGKVGFGGYIFSDRNGHVQRTGFQTAYSYHFWLHDYTQLSLGLALNGYYMTVNVNETNFENPDEPWLIDNYGKGLFVPNVDFGVYLLNPAFDFGFSVQQLLGSEVQFGSFGSMEYKMYRHYYTFGSYNFSFDTKSVLSPSFLVKMSEELRPQLDIGCTYIYDQGFWTGLTYRTNGAIIANIMVRYIPSKVNMTSLFIGYAFDFTSNKIQSVTYGTHEITMALKFGDSSKRFRWIDRY